MIETKYYKVEDSIQLFQSQMHLTRFFKELLLQDYRVVEAEHRRGELVPYHSHSHEEMMLVIAGRVRMIIEEDIVDLKEGDLITIQPWAIHLMAFPDRHGARFYLSHPKKQHK